MKFKWDKKYLYWGLTAFLVIVLSISFFILASNYEKIGNVFLTIGRILKPFAIGIIIAYLLNPVMLFFEAKLIKPLLQKTKIKEAGKIKIISRIIAIFIALMCALLLLFALFSIILPRLASSIEGVIGNLPMYTENIVNWISKTLDSNPALATMLSDEVNGINSMIADWTKNSLLPQINNIIGGVTSGVIGIVILIKDILVGIIISIYLLYSKDLFLAQIKKFLYAVLPIRGATKVLTISRRSDRIFGKFIIGTMIDSFIVGIICFLGMTLFQMPHALLISVIIGMTNVIPFFGPFIGAIPSAILILMTDPLTCIYFLLFILALQQFDGNVLAPKILGDSTGLSSILVIFAALLGGGLFGFPGMIVGVPSFAVIYSLIAEAIEKKLKRQDLPHKTKDFHQLERISKTEHKPIYDKKL